MICLDKIQFCTNPKCRLVLPADPENPRNAGFTVIKREDGRVTKFEGRCKCCVRERRRRARGSTRENNLVYQGVRDGEPVLLKVCRGCGEEKVCDPGPESEYTHARRPGRSVVYSPICKACKNKFHKERMATDPEYAEHVRSRNRENNRLWLRDPENQRKARQASKEYWRRLKKKDPQRVLEYSRISYVIRRERAGKSVHHYRTVIDGTSPRIPAEPFRKWLEAYAAATHAEHVEHLAMDLGLIPRRVRSIQDQEYGRVSLDVVSRALTNASLVVVLNGRLIVNIDDLYEEEELARAC